MCYVFVYSHVWRCTHPCGYMEIRGQCWYVWVRIQTHKHMHTRTYTELTNCLVCLARRPSRIWLSILPAPSSGFLGIYHHTQLLYEWWGSELRSLCLHSKLLTHWVISLARKKLTYSIYGGWYYYFYIDPHFN